MKVSILASTYAEARAKIEEKMKSFPHISAVFFVKSDPTLREWVFTSVLQ